MGSLSFSLFLSLFLRASVFSAFSVLAPLFRSSTRQRPGCLVYNYPRAWCQRCKHKGLLAFREGHGACIVALLPSYYQDNLRGGRCYIGGTGLMHGSLVWLSPNSLLLRRPSRNAIQRALSRRLEGVK